jgi:putative peptidoglycan lipid II flippase
MAVGRKAAGIVGLAVMASRVLGLVREMTLAAMFGTGAYLDAFLAAFQIPNLLRDLFAEGALSTAFTTVFAKTREQDGDEPAWRLAALLMSTVVVVLGGLCLLGIVFSPLLVHLTNFGFHHVAGKFELTVRLTRMLFPFILVVSLAAVAMGILNARFIFGIPASASSVFNLVSIMTGVGFACWFDPQADWRHPHFSDKALYGVCLGVLIGGLAQLGVQWPVLRRQGFRMKWRLNFRDAGLRKIWFLMWPSVVAGAAVQVNVLVNGMLASEIDGARSWLNCAFRLMQFPIGVFGVSIATVTLPSVARHHAREDLAAFGQTVEEALRLTFYLTVPAAVGLFTLAPGIIGIIYQHGEFTATATAQTAAALRAYAVGLAGYAAIKVLQPCFSALNRPRVPLRVSMMAIGLNLAMNLLLVKGLHMGHVGLAATTATLALVNFAQLLFHLRREVDLGLSSRWVRLLASVGGSALLCGLCAWQTSVWLDARVPLGFWGRAGSVLAGIAAGGIAYVAATILLRVPEAITAWRMAMRIFRRITA